MRKNVVGVRVAVLLAVLSSVGLGQAATSVGSEQDVARILELAKDKWKSLPRGETTDSHGRVLQELFCYKAEMLTLPLLCKRNVAGVSVFIVYVIDRSHTHVRDMVAMDVRGQMWFVKEKDGFNRLLSYLGGKCSSGEDLLSIADFYLKLTYADDSSLAEPEFVCTRDGGKGKECTADDVRSDHWGAVLTGWVLAPVRPMGYPQDWQHWRFSLSRNGEFSAEMFETTPLETP